MSKLVVFYSRADENYFGGAYRYIEVGNTEKVAKMIAEVAAADLLKIEQKVPYTKDYNTCIKQAQADKKANTRPELVKCPDSLKQYDEIYLGFPNYWGTMPMAVFTFLEQFNWSGKVIHPFVTHEGSGFGSSKADIRKMCAGAQVTKGLAINGSQVDEAKTIVEKWV